MSSGCSATSVAFPEKIGFKSRGTSSRLAVPGLMRKIFAFCGAAVRSSPPARESAYSTDKLSRSLSTKPPALFTAPRT